MHLLTNMDWWEWACLSFIFGSPFLLGFLNAFENRSQSTTSQNLLYENSFNASTSEIQNLDGSTQITLGGEQSGGGSSGIVVVAFAAILVLGGLYLLTRKR